MRPESQRGTAEERRPVWLWLVGLAALLLLVGIAALARPRAVAVQVAPVTRGTVLVSVQCDGTLEPPPGGELRALENSTVAEILVKEGQRVDAVQPLLRLEDPELSQKAMDARSEALRLEGERASAASDLGELERDEAHRRQVVESDTRLVAGGAIPRATLEQDQLALDQARDRLRAARTRLEGLQGGAKGSSSRVELARRTADELERQVQALTIRAPAPGVVYGLPRRAGETVSAGQVVANVVDPLHRRLRARVDQPDLPRIASGQRLVMTFDGLPQQRWEGRVTFVAPGLRDSGGREVGEVLGEVADTKGQLPTNAAVDVQIVTGEKSGTLVVPRATIQREGDRRYVYVLDRGHARRRDVRVGLLGLTEAEIVSGVREGESVILPGAAPLREGLRVRPAAA